MTVRLIVCCDSDPAPYAGGDSWPCRAWVPVARLLDAVTAGWTSTPEGCDRCPACTRALAHLAHQAAQEAPS
jgi:hypothetical protein